MRLAPYASPVLLLTALTVAACGNRADTSQSENTDQRYDPIIGGVLDSDTSHDGVVLLYGSESGGMCTGAVISQPGQRGVILTARHCVSETVHDYVTCQNDVAGDYDPGQIYILKGTSPQGNQNIIGSGWKLFHPGGASLCNADIAIIVLSDTISGVEPLRVRVDDSAYYEGEKFTAIGYGLTNPNNGYSAGKRYLREDVTVTDLGPQYWGLYENEFLGTTSICSGDSGGPAISEGYAVIGVTSRGGDCNGNDNIWTQPSGFQDLLDEAMQFANSSYMDEDGVLHGPGGAGTGGTGGSSGTGGTGGTGGSAGTGGTAGSGTGGTGGFSGGTGGTGGEDPATGGTGGTTDPGPSCGDLGPCAPDATCVIDPATGEHACGMTCNASIACPEGAVCDPDLGVCVLDSDPGSTAAIPLDTSPGGGCSVSAPKGRSVGAAVALLLMLGTIAARRRRS